MLPAEVFTKVRPQCNDTTYRGVGCEVACTKDSSITQFISCKSDGTWDLAFAACPQVAVTAAPLAASGGLTTSSIVGMSSGILVGLALIAFLILLALRRRGKSDLEGERRSGGGIGSSPSRTRLVSTSRSTPGRTSSKGKGVVAPDNGMGMGGNPLSQTIGMSANPLHRSSEPRAAAGNRYA